MPTAWTLSTVEAALFVAVVLGLAGAGTWATAIGWTPRRAELPRGDQPRRDSMRLTVTACHCPPAGVACIQLNSHLPTRHAGELGEHRPQLFGALKRLLPVGYALRV